jgi:hypothetical protein
MKTHYTLLLKLIKSLAFGRNHSVIPSILSTMEEMGLADFPEFEQLVEFSLDCEHDKQFMETLDKVLNSI